MVGSAMGPYRLIVAGALLATAAVSVAGAARKLSSSFQERFCTKEDFDECEREFQNNAMALVEHEAKSRMNAWCSVLQAHESCLKTVLRACREDGYNKLGSRIAITLTEVVNRGCSYRGAPFQGNCNVHHAATASAAAGGEIGRQSQQRTLLRMAENCLRQQEPQLDDSLDTLLRQLHRLTRDMQHLYERLPRDVFYEDEEDDVEGSDWQKRRGKWDEAFS